MKRFLVFVFMFVAVQAQAATKYVSPSGSGTTCSSPSPCSLTTGYGQLAAGDTLLLKNGTYTISASLTNILPSGSSAAAYTIMEGESIGGVTINGSSTVTNLILLSANRQWIKIRNLILDCANRISGNDCQGIRINSTTVIQDLIVENNVVKNCRNNCIVLGDATLRAIVRYNEIGPTTFTLAGTLLYNRSNDSTIERNYFHNGASCMTILSSAGGGKRNTFQYNTCRDMTSADTGERLVNVTSGTGTAADANVINNNLFCNFNRNGLIIRSSNTKVYNNSFYNVSGTNIWLDQTSTTGVVLANNITVGGGTGITDIATGTTKTTNLTSGTASAIWVDPANCNLNLKESSVAIDAGTIISGFSTGRYVGDSVTGVDQGAFESCIRNKSVVENDEPTHYHIAYDCPIQSARDNVTLQTPTVPNWAIAVAGVTKTLGNGGLVSATISGQTTVEVVLASAVTNGQSLTDAMTRSTAPTLMDSVSIGNPNGTLNVAYFNAQVRTHAASSGTNNVGAAPSHVVVQSRYRFHKLRGAEDAAVVQCATCLENVPITLPPGAAFRLRVKFRSDDDVGSVYNLRYSATLPGESPTAYTLTPDAMGAHFISWYGVTADTDIPAAGTPTTELLTSDEANLACAVVRTSSDYPFLALNNSETECEYVLKISTSAPIGTTYDFRIYDGSGAAIDTYTNTPRLTVGSYTMLES